MLSTAPLVAVAALAPASPRTGKPGTAAFEKSVKPFLAKHCYACHNTRQNTADVNLSVFSTPASVLKDPHTWEKVVEKLRTGQMPPPGSPRPPAEEVKAVTAWIEGEFARVERETPPDPGRVTARRLNRAEYNNTVRDLLGVDFRPADDFPQDDSGYGFDNIGDVLSLSPVLMEKYLNAAEKVARTALYGPETQKPSLVQLRPPGKSVPPSTELPKEYDVTGLSLPNALHVTHRFPVDGEYHFRIVMGGERPSASEALRLGLWVDGKPVREVSYDPEGTASFAVDRQDLAGQSTEVRARIPAGQHWIAVSFLRMYEGLPASYGGPAPSKRPAPPAPDFSRFLQPPPNATPEELEELRQRRERILARIRQRNQEKVPVNQVRLSFIEIGGPYQQAKGPSVESRLKLYTCGHLNGDQLNGGHLNGGHQDACARKIVGDLAHRAFRRPVTPDEVDRYVRLVELARKQGDSFEEGLCVAIQGILVSPHFLFRIEQNGPATEGGTAHPVSQHELAARLSYFLWSSMPDDELLRCADFRLLRNPRVLEAQVRRMLKDPKAAALVENFGGQWLELRKLESVKPDRERFPEWDEYLRLSMQRETELFFQHIVREDGSILDFLDGEYSFLNERLAKFYGIRGIQGPEFRKADLRGTRRGGVMTQASILTVSSYSTRTSPVMRGKWILDNLLNAPPPPPPPDVPTLDETKIGQSASLRQQLEAHRANPTCASCHSRLDPLGFALENFDAIGAWRTQDGKVAIDASGSLPDGRSMNGPDELKAILKQDRGAFTACVAEKLLTYALGRGLERYDKPTVKSIAARVAERDYRFSSLVLEIVNSLPFQQRKGERAK